MHIKPHFLKICSGEIKNTKVEMSRGMNQHDECWIMIIWEVNCVCGAILQIQPLMQEMHVRPLVFLITQQLWIYECIATDMNCLTLAVFICLNVHSKLHTHIQTYTRNTPTQTSAHTHVQTW